MVETSNGSKELEQQNGSGGEMKCSMCGKFFNRSDTTTPPFCSKRCQQIDLGHWLNESYGLPTETGESEFAGEEETDDDD